MVTTNYAWKDTLEKSPLMGSLVSTQKIPKTSQSIIDAYTKQNAATTAQQATKPKSFGETFADLSEQMVGYKNPYLNTAPKIYDATLGTTQGANWGLGQGAIQKQLTAQATGDSTNSRLARSSFAKLADEGQRQLSQSSALSGRADTGQIAGDQMRYFSNTILPQKQNLEAQIQAQEEEQAANQRQQGLGNMLAIENQTQAAKQFGSKQEFDVWSTQAGLSDSEANRLFQATTQEIQNKFDTSERLNSQEFGLLKDSLNIEASALQAQLDRNNQNGIVDKQLEADMAKLKQTQDFADKQQKAQMAQDYDLAMQQFGIDQQKVDLSKQQIESDVKIALERLGMDKEVLANDKIAQQIELAGILTQMDDSDEMAEYASTMIANALGAYGIKMPEKVNENPVVVDKGGNISGTIDGIDLATFDPRNTDIATAEKLAQSSEWDNIAAARNVPDLKNAGIDELSLDGDRVAINDEAISKYIVKNLYKRDGLDIVADQSKRTILNINGVPYMAVPAAGRLTTLLGGTAKQSLKLVALDGSGESRTLNYSIPSPEGRHDVWYAEAMAGK